MPYALPSDIAAIYGAETLARLTDADGNGVADAGAIERAIAYGDAQIDSYIGARYPLPLPNTPTLIKMLSIDIAVYRIAQDHTRLTDEIVRRYDDAIRQLKALSSGTAVLPIPTGAPGTPEVAAPSPSILLTDAAPQVWGRRDLRRM